MAHRSLGVIATILLSVSFSPSLIAQNSEIEQVKQLLSEMSTATRTLDYRGLFTFEVGGSLDTYQIEHRVNDNKEYERLLRLNGSPREIRRQSGSIHCFSPGKKLLYELFSDVGNPSTLLNHYAVNIENDERIAERKATVISLSAIGSDRYGYTIGIDQETKLPLKIVLVAPNKRYLERIQFIQLIAGDAMAATAGEIPEPWSTLASDETDECDEDAVPALRGWVVNWLPDGFIFAGQRRAATGDEMLSFTDGLASFSVFIGDVNEKPPLPEARAQLGATTIYMARRMWNQQAHSVTVVGEVPLSTAQKIAVSLNPQ